MSRWQNLLEILVSGLNDQIRQASRQEPGPYLPFVGTLFLFIVVSNLLAVVPGYTPPTASLSTTTALALAVLVAVPLFGISSRGVLFQNFGNGRAFIRQHHERNSHRHYIAWHHAVILSYPTAVSGLDHRRGASVYICGVGYGVYRVLAGRTR